MSSQYSSRFRSRSSLTSCQHVCGRLYCCRPGCKASIKNRQNYCGLESFALASTVRTNTDSPLFCPKKELDQLKSSRRHINKNPYHTTNNESLLLDLKENPTGNQQLDNVSCTLASNRLVLFGTLHQSDSLGLRKIPGSHYPAYVDQKVLKELPHVVAGVDLLHFDLGVHVAMVQEVDIRNFDLRKDRIHTT